MKKKIFFIFIFLINTISNGYADNKDCKDLKKFSIEYFKCKGNIVKDKTISAGKNIIKDTKDYQKKEWTEEKEKINKAKDKINKAKEKVLNQ
tara:strand:- start:349 stop:624 length:276 start_codon:yes stop_codon:yes gene_type:complete